MNFKDEIDKLTRDYDLTVDANQRRAFLKCLEYADEKYGDSLKYNAFMAEAAECCKQLPVFRGIDRFVEETGREKLHLAYSKENGPQLTGNRDGLAYMGKLLDMLSASERNGEHVHFYNDEPPLCEGSFPLIVYYESDEWFDKHAQSPPRDPKAEQDAVAPTKVDLGSLSAFSIAEESPPALMIKKSKLYKIISLQKYKDVDDTESIWLRSVSEADENTYVFEFAGDDGEVRQIGLDINDSAVTFYSNDDSEQIM